jgi:hypothetical protein
MVSFDKLVYVRNTVQVALKVAELSFDFGFVRNIVGC